MKTAISLSDDLLKKIRQTANFMGISRSRLFVLALEAFLLFVLPNYCRYSILW
jgi:predicted transcriptional regulator